jgi:curli biogenesis system outer membrane secretion channel CsgG
MVRKFVLILLSLNIFVACSSSVIQRDYQGKRPRAEERKFFSGVKKKVALLAFFNESPFESEDLEVNATEEMRLELTRSGEFIVDPSSTKLFGTSKEIYAGGGMKLVQLTRQAKISGINFIIFGRVIDARVREKSDEIGIVRQTKSYTESKVEVRVFDVNAGKEIYTETLNGYADDSTFRFFSSDREDYLSYRRDLLRYAVRIGVRKSIPKIIELASKLDWVGRVAKIIGSKVYLNAGRESGINIGDILKIITEGTEIYDPETGALIGMSKGDMKGTIEIVDYFGTDGAIAILHSGGQVLEGDFVQLY